MKIVAERRRSDSPFLSVISTNYNCAHALERHLVSIYDMFPEESFEYVVVDNLSEDGSLEILEHWASRRTNFRLLRRRCSMGRGREIAARCSSAAYLLVVDTDTVYFPIVKLLVERSIRDWPDYAVQAIYAGVFPRRLWDFVGGRGNFNSGEDLDMWMRLWRINRMKWYPVRMGENIKETWARDTYDHLSNRYSKMRRLQRLLRREFDLLRLAKYESMNLNEIWRANSVDMGLGPLVSSWFGDRTSGGMRDRAISFVRSAWQLFRV